MPYEIRKAGIVALIASTFALSGCFGGGSGGSGGAVVDLGGGTGGTGGTGGGTGGTGGTGGGTGGTDGGPTGPIASRVAATYSGELSATFQDPSPGGDTTRTKGTLTLDIDTDRAQQIAASATGFTASATSEGITENLTLDGTLTGDGTVDMTAGSVGFDLAGRLTVAGAPTEGADVSLTGSGTFSGADAEQIGGTVTGAISGTDEDGAWSDPGTGEFLLIKP